MSAAQRRTNRFRLLPLICSSRSDSGDRYSQIVLKQSGNRESGIGNGVLKSGKRETGNGKRGAEQKKGKREK